MGKKNKADILKGKKILIFQQRSWAKRFGRILALKLKSEGCNLAAISIKKTTHNFLLKQKEVSYDLLLSLDDIMENPKKYLDDDLFTLKEICDDLNIGTIWPFVVSVRELSRVYEEKYFYGYRQNISDEEIVDYIKAVYKSVRFVFNKFNPDLIISPNFISLPHILFNIFAQKRNIKMITIIDSKVRGLSVFTHDYLAKTGAFIDRIDDLNQSMAVSKNADIAKMYIKEFRQSLKEPTYFEDFKQVITRREWILQEIKPYYIAISWYIKWLIPKWRRKRDVDRMVNIGASIDYRPAKIVIREHYLFKKYKKFMNNFHYYSLSQIDKFIYFPLQFQPELTIDVMAPYFSNQIETARLVAMSLPGDYTLAVKEHPAMVGYRTPSFIEKISRTPNVKLIDYRIATEDIIRKCDLVISPSSTTVAEAAFFYKPAIQLGDLGMTLKLPNVFKHTDMTSLSAKIREVLTINLKTKEYEKRLENYVSAAYDTGTTFDFMGVWNMGRKKDMEIFWDIYKKEIISVLSKSKINNGNL